MSQAPTRLATQALNALARLGDPEALLLDPDEDVRARQLPVVVGLRRRHGGDPLEVLRQGLSDRRAPVREAALQCALEAPDEAVLPAVSPLLGDRADKVRHLARLFVQAARCQHAEHLESTLAFLQDPSQELNERIGALQALSYPHRVEQVQKVLLQLLEDREVALSLWASRALTFYEDRDATARALLARLEETLPRGVELALLWAMARLARPVTGSVLRRAAASRDPEVMEPAVYGLGLLGDPQDADLLRRILQEARQGPTQADRSGWLPVPGRA